MTASAAPGLELLRRTPEILEWLTAGLDEDDWRWKPAPGRWSVLEVVGHLASLESRGFRERAEVMLARDNPVLPGIDPDRDAAAGLYGTRPLPEALALFRAGRARSLALLESVRVEHLSRPGVHGDLGPVTLGQLLHEWPLHDLGHLRQIAELVRARKYHPHIGPWREIYRVYP